MTDQPIQNVNPGKAFNSTAKVFGELLKEEMAKNSHFYFFSPDETTSNKLDAVYDVTARAWGDLDRASWDMPESASGRIIEMLSENTLFSVMAGHVLSGEPAMMTSYEAFFEIIAAQVVQHLKFLEQSETVDWRPKYPAINLLSTSTCWRQDHNGFSHQSPILISTLLARPGSHVNCLFPIDDVSARYVYKFMMSSRNAVNLATFNKTEEPRWIDEGHANFQFENGASILGFASDGDTFNPRADEHFDVVFAVAGDIATREAIYATKILREDIPGIRIRIVNIVSLTYNAIGTTEKQLSQETFNNYFTNDSYIISNFHGYADTLKNIIANYADNSRISAHGFNEQGSTTTPFLMLTMNGASRYDLAIDAAKRLGREDLVIKYQDKITKNQAYAIENGVDLPEIQDYTF